MLYLIGLGLCDGKDISVRGKEIVQRCAKTYLESYTSLLQCSHAELEEEIGAEIIQLTREDVESGIEPIIEQARDEDIAFLVIGDTFGATTHADLYLRARERGIEVTVIHNASILTAIGEVGLELYKYGRTVSIPYWQAGYEPTSFVEGILENHARGLHTLCLLDIKADQQQFMSVAQGAELLVTAAETRGDSGLHPHTPVIGVARLGCEDQRIVTTTLGELQKIDLGKPPHAVIIPGKLHPVEEEMLALWHAK